MKPCARAFSTDSGATPSDSGAARAAKAATQRWILAAAWAREFRTTAPDREPAGRVAGVDESAAFQAAAGMSKPSASPGTTSIGVSAMQKLDLCLPSPGRPTIQCLTFATEQLGLPCFARQPRDEMSRHSALRAASGRGKPAVQDHFPNYEFRGPPSRPRRKPRHLPRDPRWGQVSRRTAGGNPDTMAELPRLLKRHVYEIEHMDRAPLHRSALNTSMWHWPLAVFNPFLPKLVESGFLSRAEAMRLWDMASTSDDDTAFMPCRRCLSSSP